MRTITVLGNNSGRNAGDAAILGNLLNDFAAIRNDIKFLVPTTHPGFIQKHFGRFNVKPVPLLPWYGALKNLGLPLLLSMIKTEMILITDNILFDRKFYNPVFNNLSSIALFAPLSKRRNIPIVLYNASVGPIDYDYGEKALKKVLDSCQLFITRDEQTGTLLNRFEIPESQIIIHADCALNTIPPNNNRMEEIISKENIFNNTKGTIGFNLNSYIDNWSMDGTLQRQDFLKTIAGAIDVLIETLGVDVLFVTSQVMDLKITEKCFELIKNKNNVKIVSNKDYTYEELTGLLERVEVHTGLRTHTLIFSAAVNTPMVCIKSYPKSTGFMKTIGQSEWNIDFKDLTVDRLSDLVIKAWNSKDDTRNSMQPVVAIEKAKAKKSAELVCELLDNKKQ